MTFDSGAVTINTSHGNGDNADGDVWYSDGDNCDENDVMTEIGRKCKCRVKGWEGQCGRGLVGERSSVEVVGRKQA